MKGTQGSNTISYNIYTDTSYSIVVGDGTSGTTHPMTGVLARPFKNGLLVGKDIYISQGRVIRFDIFGKVTSNQYVTPDTYTDNLTVSVIY